MIQEFQHETTKDSTSCSVVALKEGDSMIAAPGRAGLGVEKARLGKPESLNRDLYHGYAVWQGVVLGVGAAEDLQDDYQAYITRCRVGRLTTASVAIQVQELTPKQ